MRRKRKNKMEEYNKIQTIYLRDPATKMKKLLNGVYACEEFSYLQNNQWVFTEKVDGTNIRVAIDAAGAIAFGGRSGASSVPAILLARLQERFVPQRDRLREVFPDGGCLYGEGYGAGIQGRGSHYRKDQDFVLFDVKVGSSWQPRSCIVEVAAKLGLDVVPIIGRGTLRDMVDMASTQFKSTWGDFAAEGIVARPEVELSSGDGRRIITKIKFRDF
jgi:hypothetical protein